MAYDIVGDADDDAALLQSLAGDDTDSPKQLKASSLAKGFAGCAAISLGAVLGATAIATFNLNMQMRPDRLIIPDAVAPSVNVLDWRVGAISLNASADSACGDAFRKDAVAELRGVVSATPSLPIKVTLENNTAVAVNTIKLCIIGPIKRV